MNSPTARKAATTLALAAMLLRAFLPAGWMPATSAGTTLVICTMDGPRRIALPDQPAKNQHQDQSERENGPCPFAAAVDFAPPAAVALPVPLADAELREIRIADASSPANVRERAHGARAPPSFV
jgi:hypothetical protein